MKVLIVEDHSIDRRLLRDTFEHYDCTVIEAKDGKEGLELASAHRPDIIVSDALMPVMDGFQLLRALKSDQELRSIPFVFYSAVYTSLDDEQFAATLGAEGFMLKPKDPKEIWKEVSNIFQTRRSLKVGAVPAVRVGEKQFLSEYSQMVATKLLVKMKALEGELAQRKQAEEALRESEERSRSIIQTAMDGFLLVDSEGLILDANDAYCRMSGYSAQELSAMRIHDLEAAETAAATDARMQKIKEHGEDRFESKHHRKDGSIYDVEVGVQYRAIEGGHFVAFLRDLTVRKNLEGQLRHSQKLEAVGQLAGGVAHDFNNILTVIGGYGSMLQQRMDPDDPRQVMLGQILASSERAANLTRELLTFSRKQDIQARHCNLNELMRDIGTFLTRIIGEDITHKD